MTPYSFRRLRPSHVPMINDWLATPDVRRWWIDADGNPTAAFEKAELEDPNISMSLVIYEERPFRVHPELRSTRLGGSPVRLPAYRLMRHRPVYRQSGDDRAWTRDGIYTSLRRNPVACRNAYCRGGPASDQRLRYSGLRTRRLRSRAGNEDQLGPVGRHDALRRPGLITISAL